MLLVVLIHLVSYVFGEYTERALLRCGLLAVAVWGYTVKIFAEFSLDQS